MRHVLYSTILLFFCFACHASTPAPASIYKQYSENEQYYLKAIPYGLWPGSFGKLEMYDRDGRKLYTIDKYVNGYLSNDGRYFCTLTSRIERGGSDTAVVISIFRDGQPFKELPLKDLIRDTTHLKWGLPIKGERNSLAMWCKTSLMRNDTLYAFTIENNAAVIDIQNGLLVSLKDKKEVLDRLNGKAPKERVEHLSFPGKAPWYFIPPLLDGREFKKSVAKELGLNITEEYKDRSFTVTFEIALDKSGKAELHRWFTYDKHSKAIDEIKSRFSKWVSEHTLKATDVPNECDQWLFIDSYNIKL